VIIPTRNEEKYIGECLRSFSNQTYPEDLFEVLVVDGMSEDRTLHVVRSYAKRLNLEVIENAKIKQVFALNLGIEAAKGDYFIIVGGHSFVERDFIERNVEVFYRVKAEEPKLVAVGGCLEIICGNTMAELFSSIYSSPFSGGSSFWYSKNAHFANTVAFGFYHKKTVQEVGCFDDEMISGEDFELNMRLLKRGYRLYYSPEIKSHYHARSTFRSFLKQSFDYGAAKGLCFRKRYFNPLWFVPLTFVVYQTALFFALLMQSLGSFLAAFSIPFIAYWVITLSVSLFFFKRQRRLSVLPILFWVFHNVIGLGFLTGVLLERRLLGVL